MAATQDATVTGSSPVQSNPPTFAQILQGGTAKAPKYFLDCKSPRPTSNRIVPMKQLSSYKGTRAVKFTAYEVNNLAKPFIFALVGKFSHGLPNKIELNKCLLKLGLKGHFSFGYMDKKHILIRLDSEEDYSRLWLRRDWYFQGFPMRIFKWTPKFHPSFESPLAPVWITFPSLPIHFFHLDALESIASAVGKPVRVDENTANLSRPSAARVCVELDLLGEIPSQLWIGDGDGDDEGFFQPIEYEDIPKYCVQCQHLGHDESSCRFLSKNQEPVEEELVEEVPKVPEGTDLRQLIEKKRGKKPVMENSPESPPPAITPGPLIIKEAPLIIQDTADSQHKAKGTNKKPTSNNQGKSIQNVPSSDETCSNEVVPHFCIQLDFPSAKQNSPIQQQSNNKGSSNGSKQRSTSHRPVEQLDRQAIQRELDLIDQREQQLLALCRRNSALPQPSSPLQEEVQPAVEAAENTEEAEDEEKEFEVVRSRRRRSLGSAKRVTYVRRGKSNSDGTLPKGN